MSNLLFIEIIESRTAGTNDPFDYIVYAVDSYGTAKSKEFPSMEALLEEYPTRMALLEWVGQQIEFAGAFNCKGTEVILDATSGIDFSGFPEDHSISAIKRESDTESHSVG